MAEEEAQNTWDKVREQAAGFQESLGGQEREEDMNRGESTDELQDSPEIQEAMATADEPSGFRESLGDDSPESHDAEGETSLPEDEDRAAF